MIRKLSFLVAIALVVAACSSDTVNQAVPPATSQSSSATTTEPPSTPPAGQAPAETEDGDEGHAEAEAGDTVHEDATVESGEGAEHDEEADAASDATATSGTAGRAVEVSMTELAFSPDQLTVTAGETITFHVSNDGQIVHEFRLSNAHRIEEHIASGHEGHDDGGGHHEDADVVLQLEPGETGEVNVTFPEDTTLFTEVACLIPGHYEGGMKAPVTYA